MYDYWTGRSWSCEMFVYLQRGRGSPFAQVSGRYGGRVQERGQSQAFDAQRSGPVPGGWRGTQRRGGGHAQPPPARQRGRRRRRGYQRLLAVPVVRAPQTGHEFHCRRRRWRRRPLATVTGTGRTSALDGQPPPPRSRARLEININRTRYTRRAFTNRGNDERTFFFLLLFTIPLNFLRPLQKKKKRYVLVLMTL